MLQGAKTVDDTYAINVAKTEYREGFNTGNIDQVLSVFAPEFTDDSDGRAIPQYKATAKLAGFLQAVRPS